MIIPKSILVMLCCTFLCAGQSMAQSQKFSLFLQGREKPLTPTDSISNYQPSLSKTPSFQAITGEYYTFQLGVMAYDSLSNVHVSFQNLKSKGGQYISAAAMTCFNQEGTDIRGKHFYHVLNIGKGKLQPLWIGIDLTDIHAGSYQGKLTFQACGKKQTIPVILNVKEGTVSEKGCSEGWRMARMSWLNSTVGQEDELTKPFIAVKRENNRICLLGRKLTVDEAGLPSSIITYFNQSVETLNDKGQELLSAPITLDVKGADGNPLIFKTQSPKFQDTTTAIQWNGNRKSGDVSLDYTASIEYDGYMRYDVALTALHDTEISDVRLSIPMRPEKSKYWMGLGKAGGFREETGLDWKWDVTKHQDAMWMGDINGGIRLKLMDENYKRPLVNVYYAMGQIKEPVSWSNQGNGGVKVQKANNGIEMAAYCGKRTIKKGETLHFNFELLLTPFKLVDRTVKYGDRYFHGCTADDATIVDKAQALKANIMNVHHAEFHYPFINYPYQDAEVPSLKKMIDYAHDKQMRVKFYYTTREITKNFPEFWAFNSLQGEVIYPGKGNAAKTLINPNGPSQWLMEHVKEKYIPAWKCVVRDGIHKGETDYSVITTPDSRLNNYYIAGLDWMVRNMQLDGVYIDDSALDRFTLRRARRIIDRYRPSGRIDMHTWNHFNRVAGWISCAQLYMDLMPYLDLTWIGEGHNYNLSPDHWLVEYTTLPYGVPGQMLEGGGNLWRGAVFGMTNRLYGNKQNVIPVWDFWDAYDIQSKEMIGFWDDRSMVKTDNENVKATLFYGKERSILAVAEWGNQDRSCKIQIDWQKMGYDPAKVRILQPAINEFQQENKEPSMDNVQIPAGKGLLFVIER